MGGTHFIVATTIVPLSTLPSFDQQAETAVHEPLLHFRGYLSSVCYARRRLTRRDRWEIVREMGDVGCYDETTMGTVVYVWV